MTETKYPSAGGSYRRKPNGDLERVEAPTEGQYRKPEATPPAPVPASTPTKPLVADE